jgi:RNA polymerase sigma factor for flagellar operon FliA
VRLATRTGALSHVDDFWSAGALGLIEAARRFDPSTGFTFETFVEHRVRGAMLDELRRMDHLPRRLRQQADEVVKSRRSLEGRLGRECTLEELSEETGLEATELSELEQLAQPMVPFETDPADEAEGIDAALDRQRGQQRLIDALSKLSERLQLVMSLIYAEGLTYKEVAESLKVSEPRVCQLHKDAVTKLKAALAPVTDHAPPES